MSGTDYDGNGFNQGGDGAVFGDPGSDPGAVSDYDTWDWKQIEAAINGMSAGVDDSDNQSHAASISSPQSLQDAADAFYSVQQTLAAISQSLNDQATALAGTNGPWTGDAADSFLDMMTAFSKQVAATANVLSGGATGTHSVPQQLADNAANLVNAQNKISEIDTWYANQAIQMGVKPMSNGLIPISQKPQLVQMMTSDMRAVLKSLASEYQVTIDNVRSPQPITSPGDTPPDTTPQPDPGDLDDPGLADEMPLAPMTAGLPVGDEDGSVTPFPADALASRDMDPAAFPGALDSGQLDPAALDKALNPSAFPDGTDVGDPSAFPGGTDTGDGLGGLDSSGLPLASLSPTPFGGSTGTDGAGALPPGEEFADDAIPDTVPEDFPGDTGTGGVGGLPAGDDLSDGVGGLGDGAGLGSGKAAAFPGGLSTESGLPSSLDSGLPGDETAEGFPGGTDVGAEGAGAGADGGMPYMPGMGGGASGQGGVGGERSDASGLLDSNGEPWSGTPDAGEDVGNPLGTLTGGEGLGGLPLDEEPTTGLDAEGTGADGMPYMPGMGGAAGSQNGAGGERSDASGLLDSNGEPWTGTPDAGEDVGDPLGTLTGGEGLGGLPVEEELAAVPAAETVGSDGMPYMPGMGGAAGGQTGGDSERSDSSGLLDSNGEPWTGTPDGTEEPHSADGTAAGLGALLGVGFALPVVERAAEVEPEAGPGTEVEAEAEPEEEPLALLPDDRVAILRQDDDEDGGNGEEGWETAAWDAGGESLVPLLWGITGEDENEVLSSGYATAEEGTWTGEGSGAAAAAATAGAGDEAEEGPGWATWRPNRTPSLSSTDSAPLMVARSAAPSAFEPVEEEAEDEEEPEEPATGRSVADLLVQESDTWGSTDAEGSHAIF